MTDQDDRPRQAPGTGSDDDLSEEEAPSSVKVRDEAEDKAVDQASHLTARLVYHVVLRQGEEELKRPWRSLIFSGIAAGMLISASVLGESIFRAYLPDATWRPLVENLGYSIGFLLVILSRMQLFTENVITTVLPLLTRPRPKMAYYVARLWLTVLVANAVGCAIAAAFFALTPALAPEVVSAMAAISDHATGTGATMSFVKGIPAGILIAALVWMLSSGEHEAFWIIMLFTWLIAAGDFTHIIAGTVEMVFLLIRGELGWMHAAFGFWLPVLAGNIVGGTAVFTMTAWGQVREEIVSDRIPDPVEGQRPRVL
ncbi:formate/nitrite transporter family protein [Pseudoroseicyclus aestuarii]|uniref:Formate/nitrite transporter FocA (FNT family) n=1 Tax=Pseudoroseicyclus aestuarii TaxID=1795041 RepID=A0A318SXG4_9RHOB|nr:formate/nitrite transporter family protein [Pseudoroseicyclus aestuarii]PYE84517.1 formate/nitrite transporter FocA (FNT family) [Pseudoroseicyclus aestuarii]